MDTELSEDVLDVVSEFDDFETRMDLFVQRTLNDFGYQKLVDQAEAVNAAVDSAEPSTDYEELVLEDVRYNIEASTEFADFLRRDSDLGVVEMFDLLYGDGSFERLRAEAESYDEEANYRAREMGDELTLDNPWKFEDDITEMVHDISRKVEEWSKEEGLMPENFRFETHTIPQGSNQRANWRGEINQMNVPIASGFYVIRNGGGVEYDATNAIFSQFHELVGHGVHQHNSESVEYPQFTEKSTYRPASMAHCEGVSQHREKIAEQFIEDLGDSLPVSNVGMQLRKMGENNKDRRELYTHFVQEMLSRDHIDQEEAEDKVAEIYKPEIAEAALRDSDYSTVNAFQEASYTSGMKLMEEVDAENQTTEALTTGQWTPEVFPKFVSAYGNS